MEKKINLQEILWESFQNNDIPKPTHTLAEITQKAVKEAMKEACRQVLELAAENAKCGELYIFGSSDDEGRISEYDLHGLTCSVNEQSILNTINQVE